ncbi:MAG: hypothetical protein PHG64_01015 [Paludibacter sp.]|nr:hypothetical protein [Paludibacter sp.]
MKRNLLTYLLAFCLPLTLLASSNLLKIKGISYLIDRNELILQTNQGNISINFGGQTIIFSNQEPLINTIDTFKTSYGIPFPEETFVYPRRAWLNNVTNVSLNSVGTKSKIYKYQSLSDKSLILSGENEFADVKLEFVLEENIITVNQTLTPKKDGYYSSSTLDLLFTDKNKPFKIVIPGYVNSEKLNPDFVASYAYEHYAPDIPVIYQDKCVTTPVSILQTNDITVGVAPAKEYPRKPFINGINKHHDWNVGYSFMNERKELTPLLYYPVLGTPQSLLKKNEKINFSFHIIISKEDWYDVYQKTIYDIYDFDEMRNLQNKTSLSDRVMKIYKYMRNEGPSLFRKAEFENMTISAQDYRGGIKGADNDAMKNSDYGAMWMLAKLTSNPVLNEEILPYVRNFKLKQQYQNGKYKGAPQGQYYLWKSKKWVEEWGEHIEPIAITYYSLIDLGNILLFQPKDKDLKKKMLASAELLSSLQNTDGSWPMGIDIHTEKQILPDLPDLRPTFYGMYVAYKVFGKKKYLLSAIRGADWFVKNSVNENKFIGVCGDTRFAPDFVTGMAVEALMDMFLITNNLKYKEAALKTARYYSTYIYTHPSNNEEYIDENGAKINSLYYTQSGLVCEHIGVMGSANPQGPILLSSFAGMFVRLYKETGERLFLDMARASANGRDNFVDEKSGIASYYWAHFNKVALPYPQHAWWQIGWIMDYLISEAELRSNGKIYFPRGFITPKVGPHKITGFNNGVINGEKVNLIIDEKLIDNKNPDLEILTAQTKNNKSNYFIVMNSRNVSTEMDIKLGKNKEQFLETIEPFGIKIIKLSN